MLLARATAVLRRAPDIDVLVKGDSGRGLRKVVSAMVLLQQAGAKQGWLSHRSPAARAGSLEVMSERPSDRWLSIALVGGHASGDRRQR